MAAELAIPHCIQAIYHETGVLMVTRDRMTPGGFEHESFETLRRRGHRPVTDDVSNLREERLVQSRVR